MLFNNIGRFFIFTRGAPLRNISNRIHLLGNRSHWMKIYNKLVPFTLEDEFEWDYIDGEYQKTQTIKKAKGSQVDYVRSLPQTTDPFKDENYEWRENKPFKAKMELVTYEKGRSAANFVVKDEQNCHYYISLRNMFDMMHTMDRGVIPECMWIVAKQGTAFSIKQYVKN